MCVFETEKEKCVGLRVRESGVCVLEVCVCVYVRTYACVRVRVCVCVREGCTERN